jgi:hypothetical protein
VPHGVRGACGTVVPATAVGHGGRGLVCFQNFLIFYLNTNGGKLYMKIVNFRRDLQFCGSKFFNLKSSS